MQTKRIIDEPNHSKQLLSTCFNSMITGEGKKKKKNNIRALDREMNELHVAFTALSRDLRATHKSACEQFGCSCFILTG